MVKVQHVPVPDLLDSKPARCSSYFALLQLMKRTSIAFDGSSFQRHSFLYLTGYIIQHVDLCQDTDRLAILDDE
jgi:hypothetical protein